MCFPLISQFRTRNKISESRAFSRDEWRIRCPSEKTGKISLSTLVAASYLSIAYSSILVMNQSEVGLCTSLESAGIHLRALVIVLHVIG